MYDAVRNESDWNEIGAIIFDLQNAENIPEENRRFHFVGEGMESCPSADFAYGSAWIDLIYCHKGHLATVGLRHDGHWELWAS